MDKEILERVEDIILTIALLSGILLIAMHWK